MKKAVEVMFGTKVVSELAETMKQYLTQRHQNTGGKKKTSQQQEELEAKIKERDALNEQIAKKQSDLQKLESDQDEKERERSQLQEDLARMGGAGNGKAIKIQEAHVRAEKEHADSGKALSEAVKVLGLSLALVRLAPTIQNRLKAEELREDWENLKRGTIDNREKVLAVALPDPDPLLGNLSTEVRGKVRERFAVALERIYNPPRAGCAAEYLLGHVKGESRARVLIQLAQAQAGSPERIKSAAKRMRDAREILDETQARMERLQNLPEATKEIGVKLNALNSRIQESIHHIGAAENEIKTNKAKLHELSKRIGEIQEELSRLGTEQLRIAVAERVCRAVEDLQERLKPTTTSRLEASVTKHFTSIADGRFRNASIHLSAGEPPQIRFSDGRPPMLLETNSGFERRAFGVAFSLALAEITRRRLPLVIDTPLGNADSEHRPRVLKALADFDLDQIIILTHDKEVTLDLAEHIRGQISQKFLVEYQQGEHVSIVHPDQYFNSGL